MAEDTCGQIVWHDLFSSDRARSVAFYQSVADWTYMTERATDFAWGGGEKDFILALAGDEAGAGFIETPAPMPDGWVAYVEVADVDDAVAQAEQLGGRIVRHPFDVPGVGRNALVRDPLGALIGLSHARHGFPVPRRQFGVELYLSDAMSFPEAFYAQVAGWEHDAQTGQVHIASSGELVAQRLSGQPPVGAHALWVPALKVPDPDLAQRSAISSGGEQIADLPRDAHWIRDPQGAIFCISADTDKRG